MLCKICVKRAINGCLPETRFLLAAKERTKENCRCFDAADPRLRGCTPLRTPKRKSEGAGAKRTQYYCPFLTPPPLPPPLSRVFPRTPAVFNGCYNLGRQPAKRLPSQGSWPSLRGLRGFAGPCVTARQRSPAANPLNPSGLLRGHLPCEGRLPSRASPAQKRPPCQRGLAASADWGIPTGFARVPVTPADGQESLRLACARHLPLTREAPLAGSARAKRLPSQGSWPSLRGLKGPDGLCVTTRQRSPAANPLNPSGLLRGHLP